MRVWMQISALALSAALLAGCGAQTVSAAEPIGIDAAKAAALEDAGVNAADASFTTAELERKGELEYYDVDFTAGGQSYEYDIDAITGVVIAREGGQHGEQTTGAANGLIGEAEAKAKALAHAGLQESQVTFLRAELDQDDGRQVYEVEFYTQDYKEYDYEIDAATGEVLSYDYDAETDFQTGTSSGKELTAAEAKALALSQVPGATEADIRKFSTDRDDGRLEYEGEIHYDGVSYEFEIDGYSGAIRNWEVEKSGW